MKKGVFIVGLVALTAGSLVSCKKDYECHCHLDDMNGNHTDQEKMIEKATEEEAEEACHEFEHGFEESGNYKEIDCSLK